MFPYPLLQLYIFIVCCTRVIAARRSSQRNPPLLPPWQPHVSHKFLFRLLISADSVPRIASAAHPLCAYRPPCTQQTSLVRASPLA